MKKSIVYAFLVTVACHGTVEASVSADFRAAIDDVIAALPDRTDASYIMDWGVPKSTNCAYRAFANVVSNNWQQVLDNLGDYATNQLERALVLTVRDKFDSGLYLSWLDKLVDLKINNRISRKELDWSIYSEEPLLDCYIVAHYRDAQVQSLVRKLQAAEPDRGYWQKVLSGESYSNHLYRVWAESR